MPKILSPLVSVYCFRLTEQGPEYLLLHRREGIDRLSGTWQVVHGGIEPDETAVRAAWREVQEETGVVPVGFWELDYVEAHYSPSQDVIRLVPCFAAHFPEDASIRLGSEHDTFCWVSLEKALEKLLWRSQREALRVLHETIALPLAQGGDISPLLVIPQELYPSEQSKPLDKDPSPRYPEEPSTDSTTP